jgi:hypothetical protein
VLLALLGIALATQVPSAPPTWSISPTATLVIEDDGTPPKQFVQVAGVGRLSNGSIAVADRATNDIRIFDARGRHVTTFGKTGDGPGEFRRLEWVTRSADTAWIWDSRHMRVTSIVLGNEPRTSGSVRITANSGRGSFTVSGRLADGRLVVTTNVSPSFDGPPGVHRLPGSTGIVAARGDGEVQWLGEFKSAAIFIHNPTGDVKNAAAGPVAFPPWLRSITNGDHIWIGDSGSDSLVVVRGRDLTRFVVRVPFERRAPNKALVEKVRALEEGLNPSPADKSFADAKYGPRLPSLMPSFESLQPGPQGEVWVQEYTGLRALPTQYVVLDPTGRLKGRVQLPAGSRVRDVGADYVLLVHEDADGVASIRLHQLQRR